MDVMLLLEQLAFTTNKFEANILINKLPEELKNAFKMMNISISENDLRRLFSLFDRDESGTIDFTEQSTRCSPQNRGRCSATGTTHRSSD